MKHTTQFLRRRKFLLILPVLVIPFLTLGFWALGGGKRVESQVPGANLPTGINLDLPAANLEDDNLLDKLSYYERAAADSLKFQQLIKSDPYFDLEQKTDTVFEPHRDPGFDLQSNPYTIGKEPNYQSNPNKGYGDHNEALVYQKLAQINGALGEPSSGSNISMERINTKNNQKSAGEENFDRLETVMKSMNENNRNEGDPEVAQLNGMLDKILDIQHPDRIREKLKQESQENKDQVFIVNNEASKMTFSILDTIEPKNSREDENKFYGSGDDQSESEKRNSIEAVVHENQTVVSGAILKMRLLNHVYVDGQLIPKDNFLFGTVSLNNERLEVNITSIRNGRSLFPVKLNVYDLDGLPGIFIPGAITRDVAKQSTDNALQSVALNSLDPSIGAQAATAGIEAAKTLLSKKVKLIKVQVKAGYRILLKNSN